MNKLNVFLVHGFKSNTSYMEKFLTIWKKEKIHLQTNVFTFNWLTGGDAESAIITGLKLLFGQRDAADKIKQEWNVGVKNFQSASHELARGINLHGLVAKIT